MQLHYVCIGAPCAVVRALARTQSGSHDLCFSQIVLLTPAAVQVSGARKQHEEDALKLQFTLEAMDRTDPFSHETVLKEDVEHAHRSVVVIARLYYRSTLVLQVVY